MQANYKVKKTGRSGLRFYKADPVPLLNSIARQATGPELLIQLYFELRNRYLNRSRWTCYLPTSTLFEAAQISLQEIHEAKTQSVLNYLRVLYHRWRIDIKILYAAAQIAFQKSSRQVDSSHAIRLFNQEIILKDLEMFSIVLMGETNPVDRIDFMQSITSDDLFPIQTH